MIRAPPVTIVRRGLRAIHRAQQASIAGAVHQDARHVREASTKTTVAPAGATRVLAVTIVPQVPQRITRVLEDIIVHLALRDSPLVLRDIIVHQALQGTTRVLRGKNASQRKIIAA